MHDLIAVMVNIPKLATAVLCSSLIVSGGWKNTKKQH